MLDKFFKKKEDSNKVFLNELLKTDLDLDLLRELLYEEKVDINQLDQNQDGFLHICLKKKKFKSAIWLIHNNINVKLTDKDSKTALDLALDKQNHIIVKELLKTEQFNINKKDAFGRTILQDAVVLGDDKMGEILIEFGADVNSKDLHNRNVMFDALSYGDYSFINLLLKTEGLDLNNIDDEGNSIMHHHLIMNNDELALKFIEYGADPTIKNKKGETYLCNSALRGMDGYEIVNSALKKGADVNSRVLNNNTILMELVAISSKLSDEEKSRRESLLEMSKKLLLHGIEINAIDDNGETALFRAVRMGDIELVSFLLASGVNPNIVNHEYLTVLSIVMYKGIKSLDMLLLLLKNGANPLIKNDKNQTLYEILNIIIIHTHGKAATFDQFILERIQKEGHYMVVLKEMLVQNKDDLNIWDSNGNPLFFFPLLNDHFPLFKLYIKNGLNIQSLNKLNHNVFYEYVLRAFNDDREDIDFQNNISMLLSAKLNHNFQDENGGTIVHKVLTTNCNEHLFDVLTQVVLFDYNLTDKMGRSVIHTAVWGNKKRAMKKIHNINKQIVNIPDSYGILPITYAALLGSQELVLLFIELEANVKSGIKVSQSAIERFSPMIKNLEKLRENIEDDDMLRKMNMVIDQVKRDFNLAPVPKNL